ncbi:MULTISPECIES: hypothetical protein [Cyanophyceae]|uniref:hypothetical protein n=1 Tax=Cyanophyceae TaxID=3028117 RepID=UPI001F55690F|nr:hypothetical protein [Phormidium sp. FACHB-592]
MEWDGDPRRTVYLAVQLQHRVLAPNNHSAALGLETAAKRDRLAPESCSNLIKTSDPQAFVLPLTNTEAKRYGFGSVGLKGFLFKQFALIAAEQPDLFEQIHQNPCRFQEIIDKTTQLKLSLSMPELLEIPKSSNLRKRQTKDEFIPL